MKQDRDRNVDEDAGNSDDRTLFTRGRILRGTLLSVVLSLIGLAGLTIWTASPRTLAVVSDIRIRYLVIALLPVAVDLFLGGYRNHLLLRKTHASTGVKLAVKANLANVFMAAVTPSQMGGGVAQLLIFRQGGVPLSKGAAVTVVTFLSTLTAMLVAAAVSLVIIRGLLPGEFARRLLVYGAAAFGLAAGLIVIAVWRPHSFARLLLESGRVLARVHRRLGQRVEAIGGRAQAGMRRYHNPILEFLRNEPRAVASNLMVTSLLYLTKFTIGYVVLRGLGEVHPYIEVVAVQAVLLFILYFAPTPGGSGFAEVGTGVFMSVFLPPFLLPVYAIAFRFFTVYLQAALGALVVIRQLGRPVEPKAT